MSDDLGESLYLPPSPRRWGLALGASILIIALDLYLLASNPVPVMWIAIAFFGLIAAMAAIQFVPGGGGMWLEREGFAYRMFFVEKRRRWDEVSPFHPSGGFFNLVAFRQLKEIEEARADPRKAKPAEILPDTYGLGADDLAGLLNRWRARALSA